MVKTDTADVWMSGLLIHYLGQVPDIVGPT